MSETLDKRTRLIAAADELVQRQGYAQTTLADIAGAAGVPPGNVYYYFKTKDELASALIAERIKTYADVRASWSAELEPRERLVAAVTMMSGTRSELARDGCPIGSLCTELGKSDGHLRPEAARLFTDWLDWLRPQFRALGRSARQSKEDAVHLMTILQGAAVLAHALGAPEHFEREAAGAIDWIESL